MHASTCNCKGMCLCTCTLLCVCVVHVCVCVCGFVCTSPSPRLPLVDSSLESVGCMARDGSMNKTPIPDSPISVFVSALGACFHFHFKVA